MKFREYVNNLNKMIKDRPETADMETVTSNKYEYNLVHYGPSVGNWNADDKYFSEEGGENAVCVN